MQKTLLKNIEVLAGVRQVTDSPLKGIEMAGLPIVNNAWLLAEDGMITGYGEMGKSYPGDQAADEVLDCTGQTVLPAFCDSHTHLIYAATREEEFVDRINGLTYQEIAARGGGILNSAKKIASASEDELYEIALNRLHEVMYWGTGAIEIKSGYGLYVEQELKMLRVIQKIKNNASIPVKTTLLGAHAIPAEFKNEREKYIHSIINELIPEAGKQQLADFCDVFCEQNYFTPEETIAILEAGKKYGMRPKVHANQLAASGGVQAGVKVDAISVDHLEYVFDEEIEALKNSRTIATILPGAQYFLQLPYPPARQMIQQGIPVALASDYNPGSSPSGNLCFALSLACVQYKMNPEEAINAATINGAFAMDLQNEVGSITVGKRANLIITKKGTGYRFIPYSFANRTIDKVLINGKNYC